MVAPDETVEGLPVHAVEDLGKDVAAGVHDGRFCQISQLPSNLLHLIYRASHSMPEYATT